ncbi:branched-chain amino acid transport system II carrier protein [gut metagenome]|uniref:Branched-chain amino acid transport system II carrier protein n=1 Tax=gut metagenome TaxID=749906 RepID=J9GCT7_9ZZZZ
MAVTPLLTGEGALTGTLFGFDIAVVVQAVYSVLFFSLAFLIALNPEKLTQRLGKFLSPTLLTLIAVLFGASLIHPLGDYAAVRAPYDAAPLFKGFIEGYQTMDTLAALNFGLVIAMNIRALGLTNDRAIVNETIKSGLIAGLLLFTVYLALSHIGAEAGGAQFVGENGAQILTATATAQFGPLGLTILGAIFFIACLNTCVGLLSCCSNYFKVTFPIMGYRGWLVLFALTSMVISNAGLTMILKLSVPVLVGIYPLALVIIVLALIHPFISRLAYVYPMTMLFTGIASVGQALSFAGFPVPVLNDCLKLVPLASIGLEWVIFALIGFVLGALMNLGRPRRLFS